MIKTEAASKVSVDKFPWSRLATGNFAKNRHADGKLRNIDAGLQVPLMKICNGKRAHSYRGVEA